MLYMLIHRTSAWRLTFVGWCVVLAIIFALGILFVSRIQEFLSNGAPINATAIVVPGMLPDDVLESIADEMMRNSGLIVLTVGGPISRGSHLSGFRDYATLAASSLLELGADPARLFAVPSKTAKKDRTFESALALRGWLNGFHHSIDSVDIYTLDIRARRTRILFSEALGPDFKIGVVTFPDPSYDSAEWWTTSQGARTTIGELIAYIYVRFFFRPSRPSNSDGDAKIFFEDSSRSD
jgi:hypothetical protein